MECLSLRPRQRVATAFAAFLVIAFAAVPTPAAAQSSVEYLPADLSVTGISSDGSTIFGVASTPTGFHTFVRKDGDVTIFELGGTQTVPAAASRDGTTVVGTGEVAPDVFQAFVWRAANASLSLLAPNSVSSSANAVSADGTTIVGTEQVEGGSVGFVERNGVKFTLDFGGGKTIPYAVSADGTTIVGSAILPGSPNVQAFLWRLDDPEPTVIPLPGPLGETIESESLNVSADGSTVNGLHLDGETMRAFVWRTTDATASFISLGGTDSSPGRVASNGSTVVGQALNRDGIPRGFAWRNGVVESLEPPAGRTYSTAFNVSADGSRIVGFAWNEPTHTVDFDSMDVVLWDAGQPPRFLKDLLAAQGVTVGPARLRLALSVSDDGTGFIGETFLRTPLPNGDFDDVSGSFAVVLSNAEPTPDPSEMICKLIAKVKCSNITPIIKITLIAKLYVAYIAVELDSNWTAKQALRSFASQVDAHSPSRIPAALADEWIDDALEIIDALGG